MRKLIFNHPKYKRFANRYLVSDTGRIFKIDGKELRYHKMHSGGRFVRLSGGRQLLLSMTVGKMVLLTFNPKDCRNGRIAIHRDGNVLNDSIANLFFGMRKDQTAVSMKKLPYRRRVSEMAKKHYGTENKFKKIKRLYKFGFSVPQISKITKLNPMTIYSHIRKIKIG